MNQAAVLVFTVAVLLMQMPISVAQDDKAGKRPRISQNRRVFVPLDFQQMFAAGPLSDPQPPSTLLLSGATTVELALHASVPTSCRYSLGRTQPLDQMIAFDDQQTSTSPRTIIRGLNLAPVLSTNLGRAGTVEASENSQYRRPFQLS